MIRKTIPLLCLLLGLIISGCSTVEPGKRYGSTPLDSMKTAFVVIKKDYDPKIGANINEALTRHGVTSSIGSFSEKPKNVAFYVEYEDHWRWDMAMYLFSLDIRFTDNTTGQLIGSGAFRQGWFHSFPDAKLKTFEVVESIYKAK
jgi:hypothetical protein